MFWPFDTIVVVAPLQSGQTQPTLFLQQIWQPKIAILNQRLVYFWVDSRANIWHHMRQNAPLPPPINKGEFHGLKEEKFESKVGKQSTPSKPPNHSWNFCVRWASPPSIPLFALATYILFCGMQNVNSDSCSAK
jgi:uncharacterized short protein YbdD (DUF466 family)